jgi:hypothetical protein
LERLSIASPHELLLSERPAATDFGGVLAR